MRGGELHQDRKRLAWAAPLLLGLATALAGGIARRWFSGVGPVIAAAAAATVAAGATFAFARRLSGRPEPQRPDLEARRAGLERSASEVDRLREELRAAQDELKTALEGDRDREERMLQAERLASVGTLAGGIAHEVNNPLAYVAANLDYVDQQVDALLSGELPFTTAVAEEMRLAIGDARGGILRVRDVVRGLRSFASSSRGRKRPGDPKRELETALSLASNEIKHRARLSVHIEEMPLVPDAEHELTQVFVNLLVNAAQSIPEGRAWEHEIRVDARLDAEGGGIRVEVSDTGSGIAAEALPRIFDPFFTTRPVGFGAGLGLSTCHGIVRSLGGEIQVDSKPGKGSTFRVLIPVAPSPQSQESAPAALGPPELSRGRVLVVDDDPMVGRALRRLLEPQHAVTVATSGQAALELLERGERFDVLLCDLLMPDMSGMQLDAEIARRWPDAGARLAFMTGGAFTDQAREFLAGTTRPVLEKPIDVGALRALVAAMSAGGKQSS